jgi:hypothetical protein
MQGSGPPPQYAAYPRGEALYGSSDKLRALADGYFGLNRVFLINVVLAIGSRVATAAEMPAATLLLVVAAVILVLGLAVGFLTYPCNKKIGYGANWSPGMPVLASVLMALNSALCCGIIGYIVVQSLAAKEMKKYGLVGGGFGLKKPNVERLISEMQLRERGQVAAPPQTPF